MRHSISASLVLVFAASNSLTFAADLASEYQALQKELEAAEPKEDATDKEKLAFFENMKTRYGDFATKHPQTVEGFRAALTIASLLNRIGHPEGAKYAELAVNCAPATGVEPQAVGVCWAWVVQARLKDRDVEGARAALEKIKPLDSDIYDDVSKQAEGYIKRLNALKEAEVQLKPGKLPFAIDEKDVNDKAFSLANWKGKVVIIEFWATDCPICMAEMPKMVKLYQQQHDKGLEIVGVNLDENEKKLRDTIKEQGVTWTMLFPSKTGSDIAIKWGIMPIPKIIVVDRKGTIRHVDVLGEDLAAAVGKLVDEKAE